jgi:ABC-2 type transport system ATP-binding protein
VWDVIRAHAANGGSVLLTTHQFDEAEALAHRVAVMEEGRIVATGAPVELRRGLGPVTFEEAVLRVLARSGT